MTTEMKECLTKWSGLATLEPEAEAVARPLRERRLQRAFSVGDTDGDGVFTLAELEKGLRPSSPHHLWSGDNVLERLGLPFDSEHLPGLRAGLAADMFAYHDLNEDGTVTREEFAYNYHRWHDVELFASRARKLAEPYDRNKARSQCEEEETSLIEAHVLSVQGKVDAAYRASLDAHCERQLNAFLDLYAQRGPGVSEVIAAEKTARDEL